MERKAARAQQGSNRICPANQVRALRRDAWALLTRLVWARRKHGVWGALRKAIRVALSYPADRRTIRAERVFDAQHGVDTAGKVHLSELIIPSANRMHGVGYQATNAEAFRLTMRNLRIDYCEFVFVDYGSGKGKALLLASEFPFKRVIGVEFSPDLHRVAERNIRAFRIDNQRCDRIESVCMDAAEYDLPPEKAVLFFYNPFHEPVMQAVLCRIRDSLRQHPRELLLVFDGEPAPSALIEDAGFARVGSTSYKSAAGTSPRIGVFVASAGHCNGQPGRAGTSGQRVLRCRGRIARCVQHS